MRIAIDAGHGSNTAGKRTPDGYREHWANVKVASYFAAAMERCGIAFIRTGWNDDNAKDDADTALSVRQKAIKDAKCDYSISFHFNAYGDGKSYNNAEGVGTFISSSHPGDSARMAAAIQAELAKGTSQKNRGVKSSDLAMCNTSIMGTRASVLCECAFMTNKREADLMQSEAFCKECAEEAAKGFCAYAGVKYVTETAPKPAPVASVPFKVRVEIEDLNIRNGSGTNFARKGYIAPGVYTITEVKAGAGSDIGWYKLKSGAGWISGDFCKKV